MWLPSIKERAGLLVYRLKRAHLKSLGESKCFLYKCPLKDWYRGSI